MNKLRAILLILFVFCGQILSNNQAKAVDKPLLNDDGTRLSISYSSLLKTHQNKLTDNIKITHNVPNGYRLYLSMIGGREHDNRLYLEGNDGSPHYIKPTPTPTLSPNTWGYSLTGKDNDYHSVPIKNSNLALLKKSNANVAGTDTVEVHYATKTDLSLPNGTYRGTIIYSVLAEAMPDVLEISPNRTELSKGGEIITLHTKIMGNISANNNGQPITVFIGDSPCKDIKVKKASPLIITCSVPDKPIGKYDVKLNIPKLNKTYLLPEGFEYLIPHTTFNSITTMQEMNQQICDRETTPNAFVNGGNGGQLVTTVTRKHSSSRDLVPEAVLVDTRDGKEYIVRKLADGKCWMAQNLDLDLGPNVMLNSQTTDLNSKTSWAANTDTHNVEGVQWAAFTENDRAMSYDPGEVYYTGLGETQSAADFGPEAAHAGNVYNWLAATAGSGTYNTAASNTRVADSICPKGWRLPESGDSSNVGKGGDFRRLTDIYGITKGYTNAPGESHVAFSSSPLDFIRPGFYDSNVSKMLFPGKFGHYWSNTLNSQREAYGLTVQTNEVTPWSYGFKGRGSNIRCVARDDKKTIHNITTMQEMTGQICNNTTTPYVFANGATGGEIVSTTTTTASNDKNLVPEARLRDIRDNKIYTVRKLADGKCWMAQNLDLDLDSNMPLFAQNTDLNAKNSWIPERSTQSEAGISWGDISSAQDVYSTRSYDPGNVYYTGLDFAQSEASSGPETAHAGNMYNWFAATAGSGNGQVSVTGQSATDSICPKGWKLPYGADSRNGSTTGDFYKLLYIYKIKGRDLNQDLPGQISDKKLLKSPFSYVRAGRYLNTGAVYSSGEVLDLWSGSAVGSYFSFALETNVSRIIPQISIARGVGVPLRCVAR